jgi:hypothetical protein
VPVIPVAVNVMGLPLRVPEVAVTVFVPAVVPRVQLVAAATPVLPVTTAVVGATVPPPDATANVTLVPGTGLLKASRTITEGGGLTIVPTVALPLFPAFTAIDAAAAGFTVTTGWAVMATALIVAERVFEPDAVELKVPVNTPPLFVVPPEVIVFPVPEAESATVAPLITFPFASFAVTVIVLWLEPELAVMVPGEATTVDWVALTLPVMPVAVNVTGLPVRVPDVAVKVFVPAVVPRVQLVAAAIPLLPVITAVVGTTVPAPDATANVTLVPATGLLNASWTTTEGGVPTAVPTVALWLFPAFRAMEVAAAAFTVTVGWAVIATVLIVAETVFVPAAVELKVPVNTPLLFVVPPAVIVFPVPEAERATVAPLIRFPLASLPVTVIVLWIVPELAVMVVGEATTVDRLALTGPGVPVAENVTGLPARVPDVAVSVFVPAVVPSVHPVTAATPLLPVRTAVVGATVPPPEATANVTLTLATGLLKASRTMTAGGVATAFPTVALWLLPAYTAIVAATAAAPVAVKTTGLPVSPLAAARRVSAPAWFASVQLPIAAIPLLPVVTGFVPLRVPSAAVNVTLVPETGLLN